MVQLITANVLPGGDVVTLVICGALFATVTVTDGPGVKLPTLSKASTVRAYVPSFTAPVFQVMLQAPALMGGPRLAPFS